MCCCDGVVHWLEYLATQIFLIETLAVFFALRYCALYSASVRAKGDEGRGRHQLSKEELMVKSFLNTFIKEEDGQDLVEYSLLLAFIALAATAVLGTVRTQINTLWTTVNTKLVTANAGVK